MQKTVHSLPMLQAGSRKISRPGERKRQPGSATVIAAGCRCFRGRQECNEKCNGVTAGLQVQRIKRAGCGAKKTVVLKRSLLSLLAACSRPRRQATAGQLGGASLAQHRPPQPLLGMLGQADAAAQHQLALQSSGEAWSVAAIKDAAVTPPRKVRCSPGAPAVHREQHITGAARHHVLPPACVASPWDGRPPARAAGRGWPRPRRCSAAPPSGARSSPGRGPSSWRCPAAAPATGGQQSRLAHWVKCSCDGWAAKQACALGASAVDTGDQHCCMASACKRCWRRHPAHHQPAAPRGTKLRQRWAGQQHLAQHAAPAQAAHKCDQ